MEGTVKRTFIGAMILPLGFIVLIAALLTVGDSETKTPTVAGSATSAVASEADPLSEIHATARRNYINDLNSRLSHSGVSGTALDSDGILIIATDYLKSQAERDQFIGVTFDTKTQNGLCDIGFRSLRVKSEGVFGDGSTYAMACRQTKEQKAHAEDASLGNRVAFARQLEVTLRAIPSLEDATVVAHRGEMVLTAKGADPVLYQQNLPLIMNQQARTNACGMGFTGMRVRRSQASKGIFIPYDCGN